MAEQRLVTCQDLPNVIQAEWWNLAYEDRWCQCAGCSTWSMLFDGDAGHISMSEYPLTTVVQSACPVTDHDPKVMCKECNEIADHFCSDATDPKVMCKVYQLRRLMKIIFEVSPRKHKSKHWWWKWQISLLRLTRTISYREFEIVHHCFPVIVPIFENVPRHDLVGDLTVLIYITLRHTYISEYTNVELHYNSLIPWQNNSNGFVQNAYFTQHHSVMPCADIVFNYSDCTRVMAPVPLLVMPTFHRLLSTAQH